MTPDQMKAKAIYIYGRKKWKPQLARDLGVDVSTIHRIVKREQVPGPYEVALNGLMEHRRQEIVLEKAARKLVPRKFRKRQLVPRKPRLIKAAGCI
jgi:hypothetical protein